ncbi:hypothetical protein Pan44_42860 [Caulifigura coniformis]|uniref:Uncharacterized protein n=1 Tax=Caulifigura coniformis TaxID=2527983 RepID=A0A517SJD5_9PLAN|nr:hypothetical protein [Caulifigura coniformis]QDT56234.1 hypothetical protein Pan44_42860 [Caulifigura coniformis]
MSTSPAANIEALNAILVETGLLMLQISQGSVKSAAAVERVCALVAADVQKRVAEIAAQRPTANALRGVESQRAMLGAFELNLRRAAHEMNATLARFLPTPTSGTYSPERGRLASAGAWMNVRSAP